MKTRTPAKRTYEIQHLIGRRIIGSFTLKASSYSEADSKSEAERKKRGITRYRIAEVKPGPRARHGGLHQKAWEYRNHYK